MPTDSIPAALRGYSNLTLPSVVTRADLRVLAAARRDLKKHLAGASQKQTTSN